MEELNTTQAVDVVEEDGFDTLTITDLGDAFSFSQVSEDDDLHNVVIGKEQAQALLERLREFVG